MENQIIDKYSNYKVKEISELIFSYKEYEEIIKKHKHNAFFDVKIVGKSFENRNLYFFKAGKGKIKIFAWSQMHGNEPVSTMALLDFMSFLEQKDENNPVREKFLEKCTFYFLPLVNPDGAEIFIRRNGQGIDLNRDALKLTAPESQILNKIIDEIQPDFAFNMHDQERYYGTKNCKIPTIMSFLSPSFNNEKTIDKYRKRAMQVISDIFLELKQDLKTGIAKYSDSFMPNAFGDNVQKKNISTILFEAGYIIGDEQRQKVRKNYFSALFYAVKSIAEKNYELQELSVYNEIPMNIKLKFVDYILKNVSIERKGKEFVIDIAISKNILDTEQFTDTISDYIIIDIGDLSQKESFEEINCSGKKVMTDDDFRIKRLGNADFLLEYFNIK